MEHCHLVFVSIELIQMELNEMKIQFSFKETKQFCSLPNLGQNAMTSTFWAILQNLNFWGHFVKTQKSTTSCNYN